jgi:hypothetical protein
MLRQRLSLIIGGLALSLTIATAAIAATLLLDDNKTAEEPTADTTTATATPLPSPTVAAANIEQPEGIDDDLWLQIQALPGKLRDDLLTRFKTGAMAVSEIEDVISQYENRNQSVRVGTVIESTDSMLRLEVYTTGEHAEVAINDETVLRRGHDDIKPTDLAPDELVMVLSRDGGDTAFAITAFGVGAP